MQLFSLEQLTDACEVVRHSVQKTPTYAWPLLRKRTGVDVFVKHENHTPTGAFKVRGGLVYFDALKRAGLIPKGVVTATRGNHGQSIAFAASRYGVPAVIVVPEGNSIEKNAAMQAFGAKLVIAGADFDESRAVAGQIAEERSFHLIPSFHRDLVRGVATYAFELFQDAKNLAVVYVPIGMGSGICAMIAVRDLLGLDTEIVGVVAEKAPAVALSFEAGHPISTNSARTFADGMACRVPAPEALEIILAGASRIVRLQEDEIAEAVRVYYTDTHNLAEGAGAGALAALMAERKRYHEKRAAVICSGGNIDATVFAQVLAGKTPSI